MTSCPVCFNTTDQAICPHCESEIQHVHEIRALEAIAENRNITATLQEALRQYRKIERPAAVGRVLGKLADHSLEEGQWRMARHYLEQAVALGESAGGARFRSMIQRKLGALLGRSGEMPLGLHLIASAQQKGDPLALIEELRLEMDIPSKKEIKETLAQIAKSDDTSLRSKVWQLEAQTRYGASPDQNTIKTAALDAETASDTYSSAVARRTLGLWQTGNGDYQGARDNLEKAVASFRKERDPYEVARTQVDLARTHLLMKVTAPGDSTTDSAIGLAQTVLAEAISTFRRLGTPTANTNASELFLSLSIGRALPPLKLEATSTSVALIWVSLDGSWIDIAWAQALETAEKNGALVDKILGGLVIMFGPEEAGGDVSVAVETAFALHDILSHHKSLSRGGNTRSSFRIACGVGMLPYDANNVLRALATLPHTQLLKELRAKAASAEAGSVWVNATLYMNTQNQFTYDEPAAQPEDSSAGDPEWWRLTLSQSQSDGARHPKRSEMPGLGDSFARIDPVMARLAQTGKGGMVALIGLPGTGKTRMLDALIGEQQSASHPWLIHLRGRNHIQYQPFGAIRHWLGGEIAKPRRAPVEQRALHISTFQQSLLGLLKSKPLLLVVDDAHLLDSGSLDTLHAILPLMASYQLNILLTAHPTKGNTAWREVVASAERAIPNRCVRIDLPESLAFKPRLMPEDLMTAYVLACAAVLGNEFPTAVLRRMSGVPDLEQRLASLKKDGYLIRAATGQYWRFLQTAERDHIYDELNPQYRAILHWYARQALKTLGMPAEEHVHQAGLPEAALKLSIRMAQQALDLESPAEAAVHFKRALGYYEGSQQPIELLLGYAASLMSLGEWAAAQTALDTLKNTPDLSLRDEVTLLIYQGELNYRVGEVATLFRLYEEASQKLNQLGADEKHPSEEVSIIYAQALARFKRGEIEMARSMTGGALVIAQRSGLDRELAHLWELLAKIHQIRGESTQAQTAIAKAIQLLTSTGYQWQQMEPLEISGGLALARGHLSDASKFYVQALELAESAGDQQTAVRMHQRLGRIAMYRGELEEYVRQQRAALDLALYSEHTTHTVEAYKELCDSLTLKGDYVDALQVATLGIQLAEKRADVVALGFAYCALVGVSVALKCYDDATRALAVTRHQVPAGPHPALQMATEFVAMELALAQEDDKAFMEAWQAARAITLDDDTFIRARIQVMLARYRASQSDWNDAARELELAGKVFATMSATYWQNRAKNYLREIAPNVPGYSHRSTQIRPPIKPDSPPLADAQN